jgi:hypothetical protein
VHLRRALLLFAIVLGLAAIVASLVRPDRAPERGRSEPPPTPKQGTSPPPTAAGAAQARFRAGGRREIRRVAIGRPAVVSVASTRAGLVSIPELGLNGSAEPGTPAHFELFETRPGRFPLLFSAAGSDRQERIGTLVLRR